MILGPGSCTRQRHRIEADLLRPEGQRRAIRNQTRLAEKALLYSQNLKSVLYMNSAAGIGPAASRSEEE